AVVADVLLQRRVRGWAFCERAEDLLVRRGLMVQRVSLVPYGRMQFVDVSSGPLERAMGLAPVRLHTAAASSDARIPRLPRGDGPASLISHAGVVGLAALAGVVTWLVTRWRVEGGTLRVESGLLRRQSQRLPLSRVQAIDIIRPGLARALGLAEVRLRTAGQE